MMKYILFIHGVGEGAYKEDMILARDLQEKLGPDFNVRYPEMVDEVNAPYLLWKEQIQKEVAAIDGSVILIGHSLGASYLAKVLAETKLDVSVAGIFLLAPPFWGGEGWLYEGYEELELPEDTAARFPKAAKVFLYHARDDEIAPFGHQALYAKLLPQAIVREIDKGGHQFDNDVSLVAEDIKVL